MFPEIVKFYSGNYCFVVICLPDRVVNYLICLPWSQIYRPSWSLLTQNPLLPEFPYPVLSLKFYQSAAYTCIVVLLFTHGCYGNKPWLYSMDLMRLENTKTVIMATLK